MCALTVRRSSPRRFAVERTMVSMTSQRAPCPRIRAPKRESLRAPPLTTDRDTLDELVNGVRNAVVEVFGD